MPDPNAAVMYAQMAAELAPYQGRPHGRPQPTGDGGVPHAPSPDAGGVREVTHVYLDLSGVRATSVVVGTVPRALSESVPEDGGFLLPPVTR